MTEAVLTLVVEAVVMAAEERAMLEVEVEEARTTVGVEAQMKEVVGEDETMEEGEEGRQMEGVEDLTLVVVEAEVAACSVVAAAALSWVEGEGEVLSSAAEVAG